MFLSVCESQDKERFFRTQHQLTGFNVQVVRLLRGTNKIENVIRFSSVNIPHSTNDSYLSSSRRCSYQDKRAKNLQEAMLLRKLGNILWERIVAFL